MESFKKVLENGDIEYRNRDGEFHREDGPATERIDGYKAWCINGKLHREDGPAVEWRNGDKFWYLNGELHREDGPAIEFEDRDNVWYLNDIKLTEEEFLKWQLKNSKTVKLNFK